MQGPVLEGEGASDYERYLNVPALLRVPKPKDQLFHRDEYLFQVVHQTAELWFSQILWDFEEVHRRVADGRAVEAARLVRRSTEVVKILTQQVHVLESMVVWDYHTIRLALGRGSGQESPGFNGILREAPKLEDDLLALVERRGTTLYEVYTESHKHPDLLELADALTDLDMYFHLWRQHHLAFVKRMIGPGQRSLKGYAVEALERHILHAFFFQRLLAVRDEMTLRSGTSPAGKPPS
ncbi:MAG TPA: tryptophan 2,3-dioxygenase family protein [Candidatus Thermoplasmatota archaeon]|nr:tryptophan 2,3-dioxygenase family protein [Candidatus Thermoplasmatota archaeon]